MPKFKSDIEVDGKVAVKGGSPDEFLKSNGDRDNSVYLKGADNIKGVWSGTQEEYDALEPDENILYFIQ